MNSPSPRVGFQEILNDRRNEMLPRSVVHINDNETKNNWEILILVKNETIKCVRLRAGRPIEGPITHLPNNEGFGLLGDG